MRLDDDEWLMISSAIFGAILGVVLSVIFFLIIPRWW